jgi:hypothetical protein
MIGGAAMNSAAAPVESPVADKFPRILIVAMRRHQLYGIE